MPPPPKSGSPAKNVGILVGVVVGLVLLCGVFGLVFFVFRLFGSLPVDQPGGGTAADVGPGAGDAYTAAKTFLEDIGNDNLFAARRLTTAGFQTRFTKEDLHNLAFRNPALKNSKSIKLDAKNRTDKEVTFTGNVTGPGGSINVTVEVRKEEKGWKVHDLVLK